VGGVFGGVEPVWMGWVEGSMRRGDGLVSPGIVGFVETETLGG